MSRKEYFYVLRCKQRLLQGALREPPPLPGQASTAHRQPLRPPAAADRRCRGARTRLPTLGAAPAGSTVKQTPPGVCGDGPAARQPRLCLTWVSRPPSRKEPWRRRRGGREAPHCPAPAREGGGGGASSSPRPADCGSPRGGSGGGGPCAGSRSPPRRRGGSAVTGALCARGRCETARS